jgi:hypothetical protein
LNELQLRHDPLLSKVSSGRADFNNDWNGAQHAPQTPRSGLHGETPIARARSRQALMSDAFRAGGACPRRCDAEYRRQLRDGANLSNLILTRGMYQYNRSKIILEYEQWG